MKETEHVSSRSPNTLLSGNMKTSGAPRAPRPCWILGSVRGVFSVVRQPQERACTLAPTPLDVTAIRPSEPERPLFWQLALGFLPAGCCLETVLGLQVVRPGCTRRPGEQRVLRGCAQPITSFSRRLVFGLQVDF